MSDPIDPLARLAQAERDLASARRINAHLVREKDDAIHLHLDTAKQLAQAEAQREEWHAIAARQADEIADLTTAFDSGKARLSLIQHHNGRLTDQLAESEASVAAMRAALEVHGRHRACCAMFPYSQSNPTPCDCGLTAALGLREAGGTGKEPARG